MRRKRRADVRRAENARKECPTPPARGQVSRARAPLQFSATQRPHVERARSPAGEDERRIGDPLSCASLICQDWTKESLNSWHGELLQIKLHLRYLQKKAFKF